MQSKRKSSWKILVVAAAANLLAGAALAVPDAPHDVTNAIGCLTCHQMTSTYPKLLLPMGGTPLDMDDTYANRVCRSCHDGSGSTLVLTDTHSSLTMGNKYGDWTVECWVCHNEHLQEQNRYNGSTYGMYIRRNINLGYIKKPDGTPYGTGTKAVVFTGPATFADDVSPYNGICEVCHTKTTHFRNDGSGDDHGGKGGSDCVSCHNHNTGFTGGAVHNTFIADDSKTADPAVPCSGCHTNYATAPETAHSACAACHTTAPTLLDSTFPTADGQVDDDGSSMFANLAAAGYTFNGTTGRLNDPDGTDIAGVGGNGVFEPVKCGVCHAAKPDALAAVPADHGGHPVTDWDYTAITNDCLDCHDDGGNGTIQGVHSNACALCHVNAAGGDFTRKAGVDGDATLAVGRTGDCLTCHPGATYTKTKIHHDTANAVATPTNGCTTSCHNTTTGHAGNHNTLVAIQNPPCQGCHNAAAASGGNNVPVDSTSGNLVHDYCTSCHSNPSNDLIGTVASPTAHTTTMNNADGTTATNNGGGTCTACHTAYFDGHEHKTAHTMPTVALCLNCHTATSVPYSDTGDVHDGSGCLTCHDAANGALKGSAVAAAGGENCQGCHTAYFNGHGHAHTMPTVALCTSCHTATAAPYTGAGQVHAGSTCATCHDLDATPTGALIGSATGKVGGEDCQGCHAAYFDGHDHGGDTVSPNHTESITKDALCGNCHGTGLSGPDAITAPYTAGTEVHSSFVCMTCHSPVDGSPLGSSTNWGATWGARANGTCVTCHIDGFGSHGHSHTFTATADCATCHGNPTPVTSNARDAVDAPFVGAGEVHAGSSCATCHNPATGALIGSATGHAAATGCIDCHTATWTDIHDTAAGVTHATRVETDAACTTCHGNPTPVTSNARDAQATPYIVAGDVHATGCALCHTGNNNGGLKAGPLPKADTVAKGTCTTCHTATSTWTTIHDTATGAVAGVSHATRVDGLGTCTTCHTATAGGAAGVMPYNSGDDEVHDACATCHQATGSLIAGNTTYGNQLIAKGDCGTCHTATYFNNHTHHYGANNELSYNSSVDLAQDAPGTPCASCHTNNDDASGTPLNSFTDILGEHTLGASTCARCHSYTNSDLQNTPPYDDNYNAINTAGAKTCVSCHTEKLTPLKHGGHDASQFAWTASCGTAACHDSASNPDVANDIHGDGTTATCTLCHDNAGGGTGTTIVGANGDADATNGISAAPHSAVECITCHNPSDADVTVDSIGGIHHQSEGSVSYDPNDCVSCHGTTPTHTGVVDQAPACVTCHDGVTASTDGTGTPPYIAAGEVHNAVGCQTCHQFNAGTYGGVLKAPYGEAPTLDNGGTEAWVNATDGGGLCNDCHTQTFPGSIHHDLAEAANNNCTTTCHQTKDHSTFIGTNAKCSTYVGCHQAGTADDPARNSNIIPNVSVTNPMTHDSCKTCHQFNATTLAGELRTIAAGTRGITSGIQTGIAQTCVSCHDLGAGATPWIHHGNSTYPLAGNANTKQGVCEHCHDDPRVTSGSPFYMAAPPAGNAMVCDECHVTPIGNTGGWGSNTTMTISAWNEGGTHSTTNYATNFTRTTAGAEATTGLGHVIPNSVGTINNYGICFSCHDGASHGNYTNVSRFNLFHPAPTTNFTSCVPIRYVPGQGETGTVGRFMFKGPTFAPTASQPSAATSSPCSTMTGGAPGAILPVNSPWLNTGIRGTVTGFTVVDPFTLNRIPGDTDVPVWQTPPATKTEISMIGDAVSVASAVWDGTNITVVASNTDGCTAMSVSGNAMSGINPNCSVTFASAYVATINVVTTNANGLGITGYPVTDTTGPAQAVGNADTLTASDLTTGPTTVLDVLANDGGSELRVTAVSGVTGANCGTIAITNGGLDITYTATANGAATCTFTYNVQAHDGYPVTFGTEVTGVSVTVNQTANTAPTATNDGAVGTPYATYTVADGTVNITGLLTNDSDGGDGGALTIATVSGLTCSAGAGHSVAIGADNVSVDFTVPDAAASCSFNYTISDTFSTSNTATVYIDVTAAGINVKKGTFTVGTTSITGIGFQPMALIFYWGSNTASGYSTAMLQGRGFSDGTNDAAMLIKAADNTGTTDDGDGFISNTVAIATVGTTEATTATLDEASVASLDADGFTLTWSKGGASGNIIHYVALGGPNLTGAKVGYGTMGATTGGVAFTGTGFQPESVLFLASNRSQTTWNSFLANSRVGFSFGMMTAGTQGTTGHGIRGAQNAFAAGQVFDSASAVRPVRGDGLDGLVATYVSMNADGFTVNVANGGNTTARPFAYLALDGGTYRVGAITQRTSTGTQATTGVGFQPKGMLLMSNNSTGTNGTFETTMVSNAIGATDVTSEGYVWGAHTGYNPNDANDASNTNRLLVLDANPATAGPGLAEANLTSMNADGFTLNWAVADGTARRILYFAIGD